MKKKIFAILWVALLLIGAVVLWYYLKLSRREETALPEGQREPPSVAREAPGGNKREETPINPFADEAIDPYGVWHDMPNGNRYSIKDSYKTRYKVIQEPADIDGIPVEKKRDFIKRTVVFYQGKLYELVSYPYRWGMNNGVINDELVNFVKDSPSAEELVENLMIFKKLNNLIGDTYSWDRRATKDLKENVPAYHRERVIPHIAKYVKSDDDDVSRLAIEWLEDIGGIDYAIDDLAKLVIEKHDRTALSALIHNKSPKGLPAIEAYVRWDGDSKGKDEFYTSLSAEALSEIGGERYRGLIESKMKKFYQDCPDIQSRTLLLYEYRYRTALARLGDKESMEFLHAGIADAKRCAYSIEALHKLKVPGMIALIYKGWNDENLSTKSARFTIINILNDELDEQDQEGLIHVLEECAGFRFLYDLKSMKVMGNTPYDPLRVPTLLKVKEWLKGKLDKYR